MARPPRDGIDYFSFDVGMFRDKKLKLIKGEFGASGVLVFLYILCSIYEENGYFKKWTEEDCILVSDEVGCSCSPGTVAEVVKGCIRRSLFDEGVFTVSGVLTSAGIQRRFIRAASQREEIPIIEEYWLLDADEKKDVPASMRDKLAFKCISTNGNPDKTSFNPNESGGNPQRTGKGNRKKIIGKEDGADAASPAEHRHKHGEYGRVRLTDAEYDRMVHQYGEPVVKHYIQYVDESAQQTGNKNRWKDWNLTVRKAIRNQWGGGPPANASTVKDYDSDSDFLGR